MDSGIFPTETTTDKFLLNSSRKAGSQGSREVQKLTVNKTGRINQTRSHHTDLRHEKDPVCTRDRQSCEKCNDNLWVLSSTVFTYAVLAAEVV